MFTMQKLRLENSLANTGEHYENFTFVKKRSSRSSTTFYHSDSPFDLFAKKRASTEVNIETIKELQEDESGIPVEKEIEI